MKSSQAVAEQPATQALYLRAFSRARCSWENFPTALLPRNVGSVKVKMFTGLLMSYGTKLGGNLPFPHNVKEIMQ